MKRPDDRRDRAAAVETRRRNTRLSVALLIPALAYVGVATDLVAPHVGLVGQLVLAAGGAALFFGLAALWARGN